MDTINSETNWHALRLHMLIYNVFGRPFRRAASAWPAARRDGGPPGLHPNNHSNAEISMSAPGTKRLCVGDVCDERESDVLPINHPDVWAGHKLLNATIINLG